MLSRDKWIEEEVGEKGTYEASISTVKSVSNCLTSRAN